MRFIKMTKKKKIITKSKKDKGITSLATITTQSLSKVFINFKKESRN